MRVKLEDVCEKGSSNIKQSDVENSNGDYPVFGASGYLGNVNFYHQDKPYVAVVKDGAGIGRTTMHPANSSVIGTMQYLLPKENILPEYLYYVVSYMNLSKYYSGATIPHIYFKDYKNEEFSLDCLDKQRQIVMTLDTVQSIIDKRKQQLEKLDELVKSRFVEMFGDPEENTFCWKEQPLSEHLSVIGGYAFKSDQFSKGGIPVLKIGNINSGIFKPVNLVYWEDDDTLSRYKMYPGDLVMSLTGTVGKDDYGNVCILGNDYDVYYLNQRNAKLKLCNTLNKYYLSMLLKFEPIKKKLTGVSRGVRQANISNKDILNLIVPIPQIGLQEQFAAFVEQIDKSKFEIKQSLEKLELLKKALMQKYFG